MGISGLLLTHLEIFFFKRFLIAVLNGQTTDWLQIEARVPQSYIHETVLFLIYINDLSDKLSSAVKGFPVKTSLISVVLHINTTAE